MDRADAMYGGVEEGLDALDALGGLGGVTELDRVVGSLDGSDVR